MRLWTVAALLLAIVPATTVRAQDVKIGFVNLQKALSESEEGRKAQDAFKKEVDKYQLKLKKQKEDLDALRDQLAKKALVMKEEERRSLELEYQRRARDFERSYKDSQGELQLKDNELTADILKELATLIREYGKREGYLLILENSNAPVLYTAKGADLTDEIIAEFNSRKKRKKRK